ncbi:unnamed protein product [Brachionus calyciflorus]|uniref:Uncharacterized protein n=1 Tax=Brachionus calyciflorus TaxID=104777 RepID=A0A813VIX2_9BILA|nr:unnamed protein product [Brachionus calyciflorus]
MEATTKFILHNIMILNSQKRPNPPPTWYDNTNRVIMETWLRNKQSLINRDPSERVNGTNQAFNKRQTGSTTQVICSIVNSNKASSHKQETNEIPNESSLITVPRSTTQVKKSTFNSRESWSNLENTQENKVEPWTRLNSTPLSITPTKTFRFKAEPSAPDRTYNFDESPILDNKRRIRFEDKEEPERSITIYPFLYPKPPEKFNPKRCDVQWMREFDTFLQSHNFTSNKMNIVLSYLDNESKRIVENSQFSPNDSAAFQEFETLMTQLYGRRQSSESEMKRRCYERVQLPFEEPTFSRHN